MYYFSDINNGDPEIPCVEKIKGAFLWDEFGKYFVILIVVGVIVMCGWCIHWGLCVRLLG